MGPSFHDQIFNPKKPIEQENTCLLVIECF